MLKNRENPRTNNVRSWYLQIVVHLTHKSGPNESIAVMPNVQPGERPFKPLTVLGLTVLSEGFLR